MITSTWFTTRAAVTTLLLWRVRIAAICHQRRAVARAATPPNGHLEVIGSWILPAVRPGQVRVYVCGRALTWPGTVPFGAFCCISDFVARRRSHSLEAPNLDNFAIKTTGLSQACPVQRLFHFITNSCVGAYRAFFTLILPLATCLLYLTVLTRTTLYIMPAPLNLKPCLGCIWQIGSGGTGFA